MNEDCKIFHIGKYPNFHFELFRILITFSPRRLCTWQCVCFIVSFAKINTKNKGFIFGVDPDHHLREGIVKGFLIIAVGGKMLGLDGGMCSVCTGAIYNNFSHISNLLQHFQ